MDQSNIITFAAHAWHSQNTIHPIHTHLPPLLAPYSPLTHTLLTPHSPPHLIHSPYSHLTLFTVHFFSHSSSSCLPVISFICTFYL